jgi:hypothetical protein
MRSLLHQCFLAAVVAAAAAVPAGFGDTGSPPPPAVTDVETIHISKAMRVQFHAVVMPAYGQWLAQIGGVDSLPAFSMYLVQSRYAPGNQYLFMHLYLMDR